MNVEQFERELRSWMHRKPFQPFHVVLTDGQSIFIDEPAIAFGGGRAGYIGPADEIRFFDCEQVSEFRIAKEQPAV